MIRKALRHITILILAFMVLFSLTGCNDPETVKRDIMPSLIERVTLETEKASTQRDVELARDIWSNVTEYSVKAKKIEDQELSEALKNLAITYVKLIEYCESGEKELLDIFNLEFSEALKIFKDIGTDIEKTQALRSGFFLC